MNISLVTITYPPEIGGASHLIHELALNLKNYGHKVSVFTGFPFYNLKEIPEKYRSGSIKDEEIEEITVRRIRFVQFSSKSIIGKGFQHFMYGFYLSYLFIFSPKQDVILVFSPPLPLPWMICLLGKIRNIPVVVNVQDLFPLEAIELGMLRNPFLIKMFEAMEKSVYRMAANVTVHSPGNQQHVLNHGGSKHKVKIVYNWVNTDQIRPGLRDNSFSKKHNLSDYFVVSYAGTMGWAQDMNTIVNAAKLLNDHKDIIFLMVGEGVEKEKAQLKSNELGLNNILWLPMQPLAVYPEVLACSNISMINLHPELRTPVVPSKMLSIMAAGKPIVASLPKESDARIIISDADCGLFVDAGDAEALSQAILSVKLNKSESERMGKCGRKYVEDHFSPENCTKQIEKILIESMED